MAVITLTSDFGYRDGYVGAMKGVIATIAPEARIMDIAHDVPMQDVVHGAFVLAQAVPFFPAGTIHVGVIDPGVGGNRKPICVCADGQLFVGPDNGLFAVCAHQSKKWAAHQLTHAEYFRPDVSRTFHGRDIFAAVAAHLARGVPLEALGPSFPNPLPLELPQLTTDDTSIVGEVIYIDHFGNAITNIRRENLPSAKPRILRLLAGGREIAGVVETYEDVAHGAALALIDSAGLLEIAIRDGRAARELDLHRGSPVVVHP